MAAAGIGAAFQSAADASMSKLHRNWATVEAGKNRNFQERMYKNRYSYQMEDMRTAGLNPMLAMHAQPPGGPAGSMASAPGFSSSAGSVGAAMAQGQDVRQKKGVAEQQANLLKEQANLVKAQTALEGARLGEQQFKNLGYGTGKDVGAAIKDWFMQDWSFGNTGKGGNNQKSGTKGKPYRGGYPGGLEINPNSAKGNR
jgi:hypothetical protein